LDPGVRGKGKRAGKLNPLKNSPEAPQKRERPGRESSRRSEELSPEWKRGGGRVPTWGSN